MVLAGWLPGARQGGERQPLITIRLLNVAIQHGSECAIARS